MSELLGAPYTWSLIAPPGTDLSTCTVTSTVTAPDGSTSNPTPTVTGATATVTTVPTLPGPYLNVWAVTGALTASQTDQITVEAPTLDLVSLADVKAKINLNPADTSKDAKLRRYMKAATGVVENVTGAILPSNRVDLFPGGTPVIVLPERWVSKITTVAESDGSTSNVLTEATFGVPLAGDSYTWDRTTNVLTRVSTYGYPRFGRTVQVTYTAGMVTIPDDIQLAAAELIDHWYRRGDTPFRSATFGATNGDDVVTVGNYLVPNAVMELLEPYRRPPGIA